ncbi:MAG: twin-arginine translocase subunit TatB [Magnetococcales bacterium]|nr:twin-arginine translocase subunit TatB [Magnetococcales bacterium]
MFGMGWIEILIIVVVALLVVGPEQLPDVARTLAKTVRQVQRLLAEVRESVNLDDFDRRPSQTPGSYTQTSEFVDETPRVSADLGHPGIHPDSSHNKNPAKPSDDHSASTAAPPREAVTRDGKAQETKPDPSNMP